MLSNNINKRYVKIAVTYIFYISQISLQYQIFTFPNLLHKIVVHDLLFAKNWQNVSIMFNIMFKTLNINFILLLDDVFTKHNSFCVIQNGLIIKGATFNSYHYWTSVIAKKSQWQFQTRERYVVNLAMYPLGTLHTQITIRNCSNFYTNMYLYYLQVQNGSR